MGNKDGEMERRNRAGLRPKIGLINATHRLESGILPPLLKPAPLVICNQPGDV